MYITKIFVYCPHLKVKQLEADLLVQVNIYWLLKFWKQPIN